MLTGPERKTCSGLPARHLVIFVHGYGANGDDLIALADEWSEYLPDTHFVAPNAPTPLENSFGGFQWFPIREISEAAMMDGVQSVTPAFQAFIDDQLLKHHLTIDRVAVVGFSQGTMLALYAMLRRDKPCAAIIGYSGLLMGSASLEQDARSKPPVCLIHGTSDTVVPFSFMADAESALRDAGIEVEAHARGGLGHGIDAEGLQLAKEFLRANLK
ncbi:MAG: alpha/beta fold hydrolase [Rickettsiales bacterium]|nr:alpha/beta fold hydrolase [Rickettsiales bacterium]